VGDVAVVADPVHELSATGIVVPTPVFVKAAWVEGHHLRRPGPHFVIDTCGHRAVRLVDARAREVIVP